MIRCLSNVFSETGFLQILDGLTVNRTGIFHIKEDSSPALLRLYIDVAARLGVELAGMALPLTGDGPGGCSLHQNRRGGCGGLLRDQAGWRRCLHLGILPGGSGTRHRLFCHLLSLRRQGQKPAGPPGRKGAAVSDCFDRRWEDAASTRDYWNV